MQHATRVRGEREEAATARKLVMDAVNRQTGAMAVQKSPNATVADKEHIARLVAGQNLLDLADDAELGINRALPATNTDVGLPEELIGHCLELIGDEEACGRPVVLVHCLAHLDGDAELCRDDPGGLDRLSLSAGDDLRGA